MSVLIKGMEMPESCRKCPLSDKEAWCLIPGNWRERYYMPASGRSEYCPLVEVPTPHGRLIDADELLRNIYQHYEYIKAEFYVIVRDIGIAPTVIEAEEADNA